MSLIWLMKGLQLGEFRPVAVIVDISRRLTSSLPEAWVPKLSLA